MPPIFIDIIFSFQWYEISNTFAYHWYNISNLGTKHLWLDMIKKCPFPKGDESKVIKINSWVKELKVFSLSYACKALPLS